MKIFEFLKDYNIDHSTTNKNVSGGWVGICCPFCGDDNYHLGYNYDDDYGFSCWKCGYHNPAETISTLTGVNYSRAKQIIKQYSGQSSSPAIKKQVKKESFKYPTGTREELHKIHRKYLESRRFDPDYLQNQWKVMGTGPISTLDFMDFGRRIVAPIYWNGEVVSFQTRDVTGKAQIPYITCPENREKIHHKDIIYGKPEWEFDNTGFLCEGIFDTWRLGADAFCTFGIQFTQRQIRVISQIFDRVFVLFDPDPQAQRQAQKMINELTFRKVKCKNIQLETDPGDMDQTESNYLVKQLKQSRI